MPFDAELAAMLACPKCNGPLRLVEDESAFACDACRLRYAIDDGLPNLLIDDAQPLA